MPFNPQEKNPLKRSLRKAEEEPQTDRSSAMKIFTRGWGGKIEELDGTMGGGEPWGIKSWVLPFFL